MEERTQKKKLSKSRAYVPTETTVMSLDEITNYVLQELIQGSSVPTTATEISIYSEPNHFQPDVYRDICIQTDDTTIIRNGKEARHHRLTVTVLNEVGEKYTNATDEHTIATAEALSKVDENKVDGNISPILGYADEPLLSLADACAPLTDLLYNLSFYVQLALSETPEEPPDGLTIDEIQSQLNPAPDLQIIHLRQVIPTDPTLEQPCKYLSKKRALLVSEKAIYHTNLLCSPSIYRRHRRRRHLGNETEEQFDQLRMCGSF
ncbi:hypothetical protein I4U23_005282 [Adineta vaga]|nr:hypothetical protein I4U23_005282 [Adineta vaga]